MGGDGVKVFGHEHKRVDRGAEERDEDRFAVGQVIELPITGDWDLFRRET